jgi:hypothetical protein
VSDAEKTGAEMPIRIDRMGKTRWGKNWGTYERIDWCQDVDFNTVSSTSFSFFFFSEFWLVL